MPRNTRVAPEIMVVKKEAVPLAQTLKEGVAFGVGNSLAHAVLSRLFGTAARPLKSDYEQCMQDHRNELMCSKFQTV